VSTRGGSSKRFLWRGGRGGRGAASGGLGLAWDGLQRRLAGEDDTVVRGSWVEDEPEGRKRRRGRGGRVLGFAGLRPRRSI
jgi:hypothetical protein